MRMKLHSKLPLVPVVLALVVGACTQDGTAIPTEAEGSPAYNHQTIGAGGRQDTTGVTVSSNDQTIGAGGRQDSVIVEF